jgi:hypothetical protein
MRVERGEDGNRLWVEMPLGEWGAAARIEAQDGQPVVAELRITPWRTFDPGTGKHSDPATPPGGLTARQLRRLPLGELQRSAYGKLRMLHDRDASPDSLLNADRLGFEKLAKPDGRAARGDTFYAMVAARYLEAVADGSRSPVADTAAALEGFGRDYTRDVLNEARRRELLTRPAKGTAGGALTDRGRKALEEGSEK